MNNNKFNYMFIKTKRISDDVNYILYRKTITDLSKSIYLFEEILKDYQ